MMTALLESFGFAFGFVALAAIIKRVTGWADFHVTLFLLAAGLAALILTTP